jgi:hypothetical protein
LRTEIGDHHVPAGEHAVFGAGGVKSLHPRIDHLDGRRRGGWSAVIDRDREATGISIDSTAGNGTSNAYFGDLEFKVTRTSGLSTDDFILNTAIDPGSSGRAYFAADLTDGVGNTGSQALITRSTTNVPEPSSLTIF